MTVGELRKAIAAFDDDLEVLIPVNDLVVHAVDEEDDEITIDSATMAAGCSIANAAVHLHPNSSFSY
jgi:hypothetical protein